jgi:MFS family permease
VLQLLRRNRDFRLLFSAVVVSFCGDWFATVALLGKLNELTNGSGLAASLVFVAQSLPAFLVVIVSGPVADRFDRRMVIVCACAFQAVAALGFLAMAPGRAWVGLAAQAVIAGLGAFVGPASQAALPNLVEPEELPKAAAALGATWGAMLAVGASLGAAFAAAFGRNAAFLADMASFVIAGLLVLGIRRPTRSAGAAVRQRMHPIADTKEALQVARRDPNLLALLCSKGGFGLASGVVGMLAVLATHRYGYGDGGTGILLAARGVGVVIGPLIAGRFARGSVPHILRLCAMGSILYGVAYGGVAFASTLALAAVLVMIAHLGGGAQWTLSTYGLQANSPDEYRGRILAADYAIVSVTLALSFTVAGVLEGVIGARGVILVLAVVSISWGLLYLRIGMALQRRSASAAPAGRTATTEV